MTIITQGNSATGTLNYLDSVTVEAGSGFASFESPSGTVLAQFSGARTFGPYSNRTYRVVAILGDIKYSINDDFPNGSIVPAIAVMGASGVVTGLRNPDGTIAAVGGAGVSSFSALTDATTATIATDNTSVANALAGKVSILSPVNLGTGAIALTFTGHANRANRAAPTAPQTVTIDTTGGVVGDLYPIANLGSAAITMPSGFVIAPSAFGCDEWEGGTTFISTVNTSGSGSVPAAITGSTPVGSTLTCAPATGYHGTFQWQEKISGTWTDISGQTSATYVTTTASREYRCNFAGIYYTNSITSDAPSGFTDTFDRANSSTIGTASSGFVWQNTTAGVGIVSNKAKGVGTVQYDFGLAYPHITVTVNCADLSGFSNIRYFSDGTNSNAQGLAVDTNGSIKLFRFETGSFIGGSASAAGVVTAGVDAVIEAILTDDGSHTLANLTVKVNGTSVLTSTSVKTFGTFAGFNPGAAGDTFNDWNIA